MTYTVTVAFSQADEYEFRCAEEEVAAIKADEARHWLHQEFDVLECAPRNPVGKILLLDVILDVAKYSGEKRFSNADEWTHKYVTNVAAALGRNVVRVDVENLVVG